MKLLQGSEYLLVRDADTGKAELFRDGRAVWASDQDPDLLEVLETDVIRDEDIGDVLDYLVEHKYLSDAEADECPVDSPEDDEDEPDGDDDDGEEEDADELEEFA